LIDESVVTLNEVFDVYAGKFDELRHDEVRNPLDIFKDDPNNFYKTSNIVGHSLRNKEDKFGKEARITGYSQKKVGRNDPCPCGSSKKYKKCCLQ
jgi:preprotein translocase subunit SecA